MSNSFIDPGGRKGSASDHLANERTYLAWVRTAIGVMAFGFVIVKFSLFVKHLYIFSNAPPVDHGQDYAKLIGLLMVIFGGIILLMSYLRYLNIERQLNTGTYRSRYKLLAYLTGGILFAVLLLIIYLSVFNY